SVIVPSTSFIRSMASSLSSLSAFDLKGMTSKVFSVQATCCGLATGVGIRVGITSFFASALAGWLQRPATRANEERSIALLVREFLIFIRLEPQQYVGMAVS